MKFLCRAATVALNFFLVISLISPSWRHGVFAWSPIVHFDTLAGRQLHIGILNLLPLIIGMGVLACISISSAHLFSELKRGLTLPLIAITLIAMWRMNWQDQQLILRFIKGMSLFWIIYLFIRVKRPSLILPLTLILAIQGGVGTLQFLMQSDVGLWRLGEIPLDPAVEGISVLLARGQPWLRAYGLTTHPNLLGAFLATILLMLLPVYGRSNSKQKWFLLPPIFLGLSGLLLSFSRAAWLGFAGGLIFWFIRFLSVQFSVNSKLLPVNSKQVTVNRYSNFRSLISDNWTLITDYRLLLPFLTILLMLFLFRDLAFSRLFTLNTPIEAQSINQRLADAQLSLEIIREHPWLGVGTGQYVVYAQTLNPDAKRVHNVLLWAMAEWGVLGLLATVWLFASPFLKRAATKKIHPYRLAPWIGMLIINQFDTTLWPMSTWQTAVMFAILASWELAVDHKKSPPAKKKVLTAN